VEQVPYSRKEENSDDIEQEDGGNGIRNILFVGFNRGGGGRDRGSAANGRSHTDQCREGLVNLQRTAERKSGKKRRADRDENYPDRLFAGLQNADHIHFKAKQHYGQLQDVFRGEFDAFTRCRRYF
jgi:hypothetical protein